MFTSEIIGDSVGLTVQRMTGKESLTSPAVANLLNSGSLQAQLQIDLADAFTKYLSIENSLERIKKVLAKFDKRGDRTVPLLIQMLSIEFDHSVMEGFQAKPNNAWIIFAFIVVILIIPFILNNISFASFVNTWE